MKNPFRIFVLLLIATTTGFGQQFQSSYSDITEIQLSTNSADCEIIRSEDGKVGVTLFHNLDEDYTPSISSRNGKLVMKDGDYRGNAEMRWVISVTEDIEIKYTAGSGDLSVKGVKTDLTSISGSGDIYVSNSSGNYRSNTGSGDIAIENLNGDIRANTGSGDIESSQFTGTAVLNTGSGDVEMDRTRGELSINTGSGDIEVTDLQLSGEVSFNAGSGTVDISLGETPEYDISMNSGSGNAILRRNGYELNADIIMSASKERGEIRAPYEFDRTEEEGKGRDTVIRKYVSVGSGDKIEIRIGTGSGKAEIR